MIDKFQFCDDQTFTNTSSTGEISDNIWDLEEGGVTDGQVIGYLNVHIISATISGLTQGLEIQLRTSDSTDGSTPNYLGVIRLGPTEVAARKNYSIKINRAKLHKYIMLWALAVNTANTGNFHLEAWFSDTPITGPDINIQKKPS